MSERIRNLLAGFASLAVFASVLVLATQADGREATRATSNDGGAWLVNRGDGTASHVEYTTRGWTSQAQVSKPLSEFSALQSQGIVLVHDKTASSLKVLDGAYAEGSPPKGLPPGAVVKSRPFGAAVFDPSNSSLWTMSKNELLSVESVEAQTPTFVGQESGTVLVGAEGEVVVVSGTEIIWPGAIGTEPKRVGLPTGFAPSFFTMALSQVVLVDGDTWFAATRGGGSIVELDRPVNVQHIQRESASWSRVAATTPSGEVFFVDVSNGDVIELGDGVSPPRNTAPINHDGCVHTLGGDVGEMQFTVLCDDGRNTVEKNESIPVDAELRLVNGNVWVDWLDGGGQLVTADLELEELANSEEIFEDEDGEESADGENIEQRLDQNAENAGLTEADQLKINQQNEPPIAEDDEAATRLGRSVVVDVLANDSDPNGDVILVESVEVLDGIDLATVTVPTSANSVQVSPGPTPGTVRFRYTISDGPGLTATAVVEVQILPLTQEDNRPPVAVLDRLTGAAGSMVSANVLENDRDPDGDSIVLNGLGEVEGVTVLSWHPDGTVYLLLPDSVDQGTIDIPYLIEDEWQAESEGNLRVTVRLDESNTPPDARNDAGTTQVGRSITLQLLANDVDGDNDPLSIAQDARPLDPLTIDGFYATTEDGSFTFEPTTAGTYVFQYAATDRKAAAPALIRIEVTAPAENRAPIAVRDDVTLALGQTRLVRALENDGDPDGDLVAVVQEDPNPNLDVVLRQGIGFTVTMRPGAGRVEVFRYKLSDGVLESELTEVVVTRSDAQFQDALPIAVDDSIRVRAGRTSRLFVLRNDFDPEGGPLKVTDVSSESDLATISSDGTWIDVRVPLDQVLPFTVQYTIADEEDQVAAATAQVVIVQPEEPNSPPTARPDVQFTLENTPVIIPVLANDTDPESDALSVVAIPRAPKGGSAIPLDDGAGFEYTPTAGFLGTDQFTYLLRDSEGGESTGYVTVGVMPIPRQNRPPVAGDDIGLWEYAADGTEATLPVLENDSDPDGDPLEIISATGEVLITESGQAIRYQLPESVSEAQTIRFSYTISDGRLGTDDAVVEFTLAPTVDPLPPIAAPDVSDPVHAGETVTIDVLENDTDPDGDDELLRLVSIDAPAVIDGRRVSIVAPTESVELRYTIADETGLENSSFLTVVVQENLPPDVQSPIFLGEFNNDAQIPQINVADFVQDADDDIATLIFAGVSGVEGGTTQLDQNARDQRLVTFLPSAEFQGAAGFSFTVEDAAGNLASGRVTLTLLGLSNEPPVGSDQNVMVEAGVDLPFDASTLFEDPDLDQRLTYELLTGPANQLELAGTLPDVVLRVPITAAASETAFTIRATDPEGESANATVTVRVNESTIGPPVTGNIDEEINQGDSISLPVVAAATNTLGSGALRVIGVSLSDPAAGTVTIAADGSNIAFQSFNDYSGDVQVRYTISDDRESGAGQAEGLATVKIVGRPDAPAGLGVEAVGPNNVVLTWLSPNGNGAAIDGYRIRVNGGQVRDHLSTSPTFRLDDLAAGDDYTFEVLAFNKAGDGIYSNASPQVTPDEIPGPPGRPTVNFVDGSPGSLFVQWGASANNGSAINTYRLEISLCGSEQREIGTGTDYTWDNLTNGSECSFRVTAVNKAGDSPTSVASDSECAVDTPQAPAGPVAVRGDKEAVVSWSAPTNPDCQPLQSYEIVRYLNGAENGRTSVPFGTVQWTSAPLQNGESYSFAVRAQNRQGWGAESARSAVVTPCGVPLATAAPTALAGDEQITVTRSGDANENGCAVTQYVVRVNGGADQQLPANGVIAGLTNGTDYTFAVAGVNEIGVGEFSPASAAIKPFGAPFVPTMNASVCGAVQCNGSWVVNIDNADDNGNPITDYQFSGDAEFFQAAAGPDIQVVCLNNRGNYCRAAGTAQASPPTGCLQNAQTVTIRGWAVNSAGAGDQATWTRSLAGCPSAPSLSIANGNGQFTANFSRPAGTDNVYIQVNGSYGSPVGGSSKTFNANNGQNYSVTAWACNEYGCSKSPTRTARPVAPPSPSITITSWGDNVGRPTGCNNEDCYKVNYSFSNFTPNRLVDVQCRDDNGTFWTFQIDTTGDGAGSGQSVCYSGKAEAAIVGFILRMDGVSSNRWS